MSKVDSIPTKGLNKIQWLSLAVVLAITLAVFIPTTGYDFVNWDDMKVVVDNGLVHKGLRAEMFREAFSTPQVGGLYDPITQVSFAFNYELSGLDAGSYHALNLALHLLNTALVFLVLLKLFRKSWMAAWIALLFAVHPMHVEPVAWVASRKDVLYLFFMLGAWWVYLKAIELPRRRMLLLGLSVFLMLCSVLSKPAGIVLPFVLLLTDYLLQRKDWGKLLLEKLPFLLITVVFTLVGYLAQKAAGAITDAPEHTTVDSVFYASTAFLSYLAKAVVPIRLAAFHPYPAGMGAALPWYVWASLLPALALLALAVWAGRKNRAIGFGAGVFVVSILPFLQLVPVGPSLTAERFTYFPYLGLFVLLWLGMDWAAKKNSSLRANETRWSLVLLGLSLPLVLLSTRQVPTWKDGEALWTQVLRVHPSSGEAYLNRADHHLRQGDLHKAIDDFNRAIAEQPGMAAAYNNRGMIYLQQDMPAQALADFNRSLELDSNQAMATMNRGLVYMNQGEYGPAMRDFDRSLSLDSSSYKVYYNRGYLKAIRGQYAASVQDFDRAIALNPSHPVVHKDRAMAQHLLKAYPKAIADYGRAIELDPGYAEAWIGRSHTYFEMGDLEHARMDARKAEQLGMTVPREYWERLGE